MGHLQRWVRIEQGVPSTVASIGPQIQVAVAGFGLVFQATGQLTYEIANWELAVAGHFPFDGPSDALCAALRTYPAACLYNSLDRAGFLYVGQNHGLVWRVDKFGVVTSIAAGFGGDPITGIAVYCAGGKGTAGRKPCFSVRTPLVGP